MPVDTNPRILVNSTIREFRSSWKPLVLTAIAFKVIAFIVLTPLLGLLFRTLIALSGSAVKCDLDILSFFLGPIGWSCFILVGALWLGIGSLEQASLMGIICAKNARKDLGLTAALKFAAGKFWAVLRLTIRIVARTLLAIAPFVAVAAAVYFALLTEYDINYYLLEKPPVFGVAVGIGVLIAAALLALLLRLFTSWFFALPLVLFEDVKPREALKLSSTRVHGHRGRVLCWIVGWLLGIATLSTFATGMVGLMGRLIIPDSSDSLRLLAVAIGATLLLWAVASFVVNLLSATTFAAILFNLYQELGSDGLTGSVQADFAADAKDSQNLLVTRRRLIVAGIIGIIASVAAGAVALQSVRLDDDVKIMAHRGLSKAAPENTMAAFRRAITDGADWIELDVQETADGEVVVFHDKDFMKLASRKLKIWDATMDDLNDIDIGSWFAPEFKDQRVPTLAAVLDECKGKIRVNIELKYYGHQEQLEQRVADIVEARGMASDVVAMSLKMDGVNKMKSIRPDWKVGQLMSVYAGDLKKLEADFLAVNAGFANRSLIRTAHNNGKEVYVWTVNDAPTMSTMISRGVDGLLTDKPALAQSVLQQRARMSTSERLLLELAGLLGSVRDISEQ